MKQITLQEMEELILAGKERKDIKGDMSDMEYNRALHKVLHKLGNVQSNLVRINYIKDIEQLFFATVELYHESQGVEKFFYRNRMNHLGSVYATYRALLPVKKVEK